MKKLMSLFSMLVLMLLVVSGCSSNAPSSEEVKKETVAAYVETVNKMQEQQSNQKFSLAGKVDLPKSMMVNEAVNANVELSGIIDLKDQELKMDLTFTDGKNPAVNANVYVDRNYAYIYDGKAWSKAKIDTDYIDRELKKQETTKAKVADVQKYFDEAKETSYKTEKRDGKDGYAITSTYDKDTLKKLINTAMETAKKEVKDAQSKAMLENFNADIFDKFDLTYNIFVPKDHSGFEIYDMNLGLSVLQTTVNINGFNLKTENTNDKVSIPKEAKDAKKVDLPANTI